MPRFKISSDVQIKDQWAALEKAINDTLSERSSEYQQFPVVQACTYLVQNGRGDEVFTKFCDILNEHYKKCSVRIQNTDGKILLQSVSDIFDKFKYHCKVFPTLYTSYDQSFPNEPEKTISSIKSIFGSTILSDLKTFNESITPLILDEINSIRTNKVADSSIVKKIISLYYLFRKDKPEIFNYFIDKLDESTEKYGNSFFEDNFKHISFSSYLENASKIYDAQLTLLERLLEPTEVKNNLKKLFDSIIKSREHDFINKNDFKIAQPLEMNGIAQFRWLVNTYAANNYPIKPLYDVCALYINKQMLRFQESFPAYISHMKKVQEEREKKGYSIKPEDDKNLDDITWQPAEDEGKQTEEAQKPKVAAKKAKKATTTKKVAGKKAKESEEKEKEKGDNDEKGAEKGDNDEKGAEKGDNDEKGDNEEKGAKSAKSSKSTAKKPLKSKKTATKKAASKNNLSGYMLLAKVMDRASFLIEQYTKVFPDKDAQRVLNDQVTVAWNNKFFESPLHFAQYIDYLVRNEFRPVVLRNIQDESELKKYRQLAQFFSYFDDKITVDSNCNLYYCLRISIYRSKYHTQDDNVIKSIRKTFNEFLSQYDQYENAMKESKDFEDEFQSYLSNSPDKQSHFKNVKPLLFNPNALYAVTSRRENRIPLPAIECDKDFVEFYKQRHRNTELVLQQETSLVELKLNIDGTSTFCTIICDLPVGQIIHTISERSITYKEILDMLGVPPNPCPGDDDIDEDALDDELKEKLSKYTTKFNCANDIISCLLGMTSIMGALIERTEFKNKKISDDDVFTMKSEFVTKNYNKVVFIPSAYKADMSKEIDVYAENERNLKIQMTIGQIVKREKIISKAKLYGQVIKNARDVAVPTEQQIHSALVPILYNELNTGQKILEFTDEEGNIFYKYV